VGKKVPVTRAARGARKNAGRCTKTLTLQARLPTILPYTVVSEAWVPPELLKGQRGSFGRQPSLAPPPRGVCSWWVTSIVYFPSCVSIFFCVRTPHDCGLARA